MLNTRIIFIIGFYSILSITLLFGIWPFNLWQQNEVQWLENERGINFFKLDKKRKYANRGIVYTNESFRIPSKSGNLERFISIELFLQPRFEPKSDAGMIVTFQNCGQQPSLILAQWKKQLIVRIPNLLSENQNDFTETAVSNVFPKNVKRLITITSSNAGTKFYINGEFKKHFPTLSLISGEKEINGKMILGVSPSGKDPWSGKLYGIGIYEDELSPLNVKQNYQAWLSNDDANLLSEEKIIALYTFSEGNGVISNNRVGSDRQLKVPKNFIVLDKIILKPPWKDFNFDTSFKIDFIKNLFGFVPLGIIMLLYLRKVLGINGRRSIIMTLVIGSTLSLFIELLQVFMPQRYSSLSDLILNISGLFIGILFLHFLSFLKKRGYN